MPGTIVNHNAGTPGTIEAWEAVEPDSFRMMLARSPRTGNLIPGLFFRLKSSESEVWQITGDRVKRAEGWLRKLYREKREEEARGGTEAASKPVKPGDDEGVEAL
jgi:hypothetical protein